MNDQDREERKQSLVGIDAGQIIRQAQREVAQRVAEGRRRAEIDARDAYTEPPMEVHCMVFQEKDGVRLETIQDAFPGMDTIRIKDRTERLCVAELRWQLANQLHSFRCCPEADARKKASLADVKIHGRVTL